MTGKKVQITVASGTNPITDNTELNTVYFTETDKVFFEDGRLTSLPGWESVETEQTLLGGARNIFSYISGKKTSIIGTNTRLYAFVDYDLNNITPVKTGTIAIANSLDSYYTTLGTNPIATTNGSNSVVITQSAHRYQVNDIVTISGVPGAINNIPNTELNAAHSIVDVDTNTFTIVVTTNANATGSGGGAAVISASRIVVVDAASHGLANGDRVKITGAAGFAGIPAGDINTQHIIRNITANTFDIVVATTATSSVSNGGGASTVYSEPIDSGNLDAAEGVGYGGGDYGEGTYGTAKTFTSGLITYPRIWSVDRFGNDVVMTPGNDGDVYIWQNDLDVAPTILTNSPTANWLFVSNNAVVVLGADGVDNSIAASDIGDATVWTPAPDNNAYYDEVEGVGRFVTHARARNIDLLFTEQEVFTFQFDGVSSWNVNELFNSDGIVGPKACANVEGSVFWMGTQDFYFFDGASVQKMPNNTVYFYIYDNLNRAQQWKVFTRVDITYNQVWFFFPTGTSTECNEYVIFDYRDKHWTLGTLERTAAEEPTNIFEFPLMADSVSETIPGALYYHNNGNDDDGVAMESYAISNYMQAGEGDNIMEITQITPDSLQSGTVNMTVYTKDYPQSSEEFTYSGYQITPTTNFVDVRISGRQRKYELGKDSLGAYFSIGKWFETINMREADR